ncbi:unnamed protein product, partial [Mesorhabditis belari]|uniref:Uncharacterized protein n=1 Tax=Mesorhabditis belari TaxID=2138241 RepID=A0AAF3F5L9_9BILA
MDVVVQLYRNNGFSRPNIVLAGIRVWWSNVEQSELMTESIVTHPTMDAALGKLNATFDFTGRYVRPVCLTRNTSFLTDGAPIVLYGLGLNENDQIPTIVQKVFATNVFLGGPNDTLIYANSTIGYVKNGDDGSPYLTKFNGRWYQVGFLTNISAPPSTLSSGPKLAPLCDWIAEDRLKVILYERDTFTADDKLFTVDECKDGCTLSTDDNSDFSPNLEFAFKFTGSCVQMDFTRCIAVEDISSRTERNILNINATFDKYSANDAFYGDNLTPSPLLGFGHGLWIELLFVFCWRNSSTDTDHLPRGSLDRVDFGLLPSHSTTGTHQLPKKGLNRITSFLENSSTINYRSHSLHRSTLVSSSTLPTTSNKINSSPINSSTLLTTINRSQSALVNSSTLPTTINSVQ